jgi:hypothetical protein
VCLILLEVIIVAGLGLWHGSTVPIRTGIVESRASPFVAAIPFFPSRLFSHFGILQSNNSFFNQAMVLHHQAMVLHHPAIVLYHPATVPHRPARV